MTETRPRFDDDAAAISPGRSLQEVAASITTRPFMRRGVAVSDEVIRVMLVDDHVILREGVRALLHGVPDMQVVAEASDGVEALAAAMRSSPDVVVMDLDMPGGDGATATEALAAFEHPPRVLILTMHREEEQLVSMLERGAAGFLSKEAAERELVEAIRVVASGDVYVRPSVARLLAANMRRKDKRTPAEEAREQLGVLSGRELTVLRMVAEGYSGVEIGGELGITPKTVDTYKHRIADKLGFTHRTEYVRFALRTGLIDPDVETSQPSSPDGEIERNRPARPASH